MHGKIAHKECHVLGMIAQRDCSESLHMPLRVNCSPVLLLVVLCATLAVDREFVQKTQHILRRIHSKYQAKELDARRRLS